MAQAPGGETPLDIARTFVEFVDPDEPGQRFRCDLTWLTSDYRCIFGAGCPGVLRDHPDEGCCAHGAHFTEPADETRVAAVVDDLGDDEWQYRDLGAGGAWAVTEDGERKTAVVDGACILLNRPGFPAGAGCALHQRAHADGLPPHTLKPEVCWQLPIRRAYREVELPDGTSYLEVTIGEYDRRGWGPGGADFDWYCTGSPLAHTGDTPLYRSSEVELRELMGDGPYAVLAEHAAAHLAAVAAAEPARLPLLLHPATLLARAGDHAPRPEPT